MDPDDSVFSHGTTLNCIRTVGSLIGDVLVAPYGFMYCQHMASKHGGLRSSKSSAARARSVERQHLRPTHATHVYSKQIPIQVATQCTPGMRREDRARHWQGVPARAARASANQSNTESTQQGGAYPSSRLRLCSSFKPRRQGSHSAPAVLLLNLGSLESGRLTCKYTYVSNILREISVRLFGSRATRRWRPELARALGHDGVR